MPSMITALKERIGDPSLFCGRKKEIALLKSWTDKIPRQISKSRALLGRRKCGKTAIMQRLFNILWNEQGRVVPLYIEIKDQDQWIVDFAYDYFHTFMSQYLSFLTRTVLPPDNEPWEMDTLKAMGRRIKNDNVLKRIDNFLEYYDAQKEHLSMRYAFNTPAWLAGTDNVFCLVMIDEIQYMTEHIYRDQDFKVLMRNLPGAYHGLSESKTAPMLVSGSYVGWMVRMMREMFVGGRLKQTEISTQLAFDEGMQAVYKYAEYNGVSVSDESALVINLLTQSDPFYIATLFRSDWEKRDFKTVQGAIDTLEYEIKNRKGELFGTWSEYIDLTMQEVNGKHAKKILLFLSKERFRECTRDEIRAQLNDELEDKELEDKLRTLESGDLITRGVSNIRYRGIPDDILDLIFRELYQEEIERVKPDIGSELAAKVQKLEREKCSLQGALNELKGRMPELIVFRELNRCCKTRQPVKNFRQRLRPVSNQELRKKMQVPMFACAES